MRLLEISLIHAIRAPGPKRQGSSSTVSWFTIRDGFEMVMQLDDRHAPVFVEITREGQSTNVPYSNVKEFIAAPGEKMSEKPAPDVAAKRPVGRPPKNTEAA